MGAGELYNAAAISADPRGCFIISFKHSWRQSVGRPCQQVMDDLLLGRRKLRKGVRNKRNVRI